MVLPVFLHALLFRRAKVWAWRWRIGVALTLCLYLFGLTCSNSFTHIRPTQFLPIGSALLGWLFPFFGGQFLTLGVAGTMRRQAGRTMRPAFLESAVGNRAMDFARGGSRCLAWHGLAIPRTGR